MLEAVRQLSPKVEYDSIDEFFFQAMPYEGQSYQTAAPRLAASFESISVPEAVKLLAGVPRRVAPRRPGRGSA